VGEAQALRPGVACARFCDALLAVLLAPACAACNAPLDHPTHGPVCAACWRSILPLTPPLCDGCGDPLPTWRTISRPLARCARCRRARRHVDRSRAIGAYEGALRSVVHALKYDGRRSLAGPLAALMRDRGRDLLEGVDAAVAVPLHPSRRRERGFNQAGDLARRLGVRYALLFDASARRRRSPACRRAAATATCAGLFG